MIDPGPLLPRIAALLEGTPYRTTDTLLHRGSETVIVGGEGPHGSVVLRALPLPGRADPDLFEKRLNPLLGVTNPGLAGIRTIRWSDDKELFLVVEDRIPGESLAERPMRLDPTGDPSIVLTLAAALAAIHEAGGIHGGIGPGRLIRDEDAKLLRLCGAGISAARLEEPSLRLAFEEEADLAFFAPELLATWLTGDRPAVTRASDVYAFCALLHLLWIGHPPPFEPDLLQEGPEQIRRGFHVAPYAFDPQPPEPLSRLIERGTHPNPSRRFSNGTALLETLEPILSAGPERPSGPFVHVIARPEDEPDLTRERARALRLDAENAPLAFLDGTPWQGTELVHPGAATVSWRATGPDGDVCVRIFTPVPPPLPVFAIDGLQVMDRALEAVGPARVEGMAGFRQVRETHDGDARVIVEDWIEGAPLRDAILERDEALGLLRTVAESLVGLHARGQCHGGVRPSRILVRDGTPVLVGRGVGIYQNSGIDWRFESDEPAWFLPRFAYRSPEQIAGLWPTPRSDVFALGVLAYRLLTDELPFTGDSLPELGADIRTAPLRFPGDLEPGICTLLTRCLAREPEDRFPDARTVSQAIARL